MKTYLFAITIVMVETANVWMIRWLVDAIPHNPTPEKATNIVTLMLATLVTASVMLMASSANENGVVISSWFMNKVFRLFFSLPSPVIWIRKKSEKSTWWQVTMVLMSPFLTPWMLFLCVVLTIDACITLAWAAGYSWHTRLATVMCATMIGVVGMPLWGWASLVHCAVVGVLIALITTIVSLSITSLGENGE